MAGERPRRTRMNDRIKSAGLPVRSSGKCHSCGVAINLFRDTKPDPFASDSLVVATCPDCKSQWFMPRM